LRGVGHRLAEKIWEIVESGQLRKLDELTSLEETKALELFTNVWGAGIHLFIMQEQHFLQQYHCNFCMCDDDDGNDYN